MCSNQIPEAVHAEAHLAIRMNLPERKWVIEAIRKAIHEIDSAAFAMTDSDASSNVGKKGEKRSVDLVTSGSADPSSKRRKTSAVDEEEETDDDSEIDGDSEADGDFEIDSDTEMGSLTPVLPPDVPVSLLGFNSQR